MKKLIALLLISFIGFTGFSQRNDSDWMLSVGVNAVGNLGTRNPVERLDEFVIRHPVAIAIERKWTRYLNIEQDFSLNGFKANTFVDNGIPNENLTYFSTNTSLKYYFGSHLFDSKWFDPYVSGGIGLFHMDELNTSANVSGGVLFWFSDNIGLRLQSTGKFAFSAKDRKYDNNHWQFFMQMVFQL